jgi:uncharacterized membrane protein YjjP (DUF1212 family)
MTSDERRDLSLAFARTPFINGQATDQTVAAAERLARTLGLCAKIMARWGELELHSDYKDGTGIYQVAADPAGVDMDRVTSTMRAIDDVEAGWLAPDAAIKAIATISQASPSPTWLFAFAAAAGAVALSVIFGVDHFLPMVLIFVSAGAGAILRRALARLSANDFVQPFCAALLAGLIGGLAVRYDLSSSRRHPLLPVDARRLTKSLHLLVGFLLGCVVGAAAVALLGDWAWSLPAALAAVAITVR